LATLSAAPATPAPATTTAPTTPCTLVVLAGGPAGARRFAMVVVAGGGFLGAFDIRLGLGRLVVITGLGDRNPTHGGVALTALAALHPFAAATATPAPSPAAGIRAVIGCGLLFARPFHDFFGLGLNRG